MCFRSDLIHCNGECWSDHFQQNRANQPQRAWAGQPHQVKAINLYHFVIVKIFNFIVFFNQIVNRHPPFGNQIRESVIHLPKYEVILEQVKIRHN